MFEGSTIHVAGSDPVVLANRVQYPSIRGNTIKGPYLTIVVAGQYPEAHGYGPLRGHPPPPYTHTPSLPPHHPFAPAVRPNPLPLRSPFSPTRLTLPTDTPAPPPPHPTP